jgi:hypothetical protein
MPGFIYGEQENGGTNTLYVSPVPFEILDASIEKGPGRPGLARYPDRLEAEADLSGAMLIAPFAGVAAGALHAVRLARKNRPEGSDDE